VACEQLLEDIGVSSNSVALGEFAFGFVQLDYDILSLEYDWVFKEVTIH